MLSKGRGKQDLLGQDGLGVFFEAVDVIEDLIAITLLLFDVVLKLIDVVIKLIDVVLKLIDILARLVTVNPQLFDILFELVYITPCFQSIELDFLECEFDLINITTETVDDKVGLFTGFMNLP